MERRARERKDGEQKEALERQGKEKGREMKESA